MVQKILWFFKQNKLGKRSRKSSNFPVHLTIIT
jgi:hypothetical protein